MDNNTRLLGDSLIFTYDKYFYDKDSIQNTISRMKKLWLRYLLVDLNAATIDKDPRRNLTKRYENLLKVFTWDNLKLIETDSICLKLALEQYHKSDKTEADIKNYMSLAWVNYNSYLSKKLVSTKGNKILNCYNNILELINSAKISNSNYSYLLPLKKDYDNWIKNNKIKTKQDLFKLLSFHANHGFKVLFRIE